MGHMGVRGELHNAPLRLDDNLASGEERTLWSR